MKPAVLPTVVYLVSHPIQYQAPLFRLLARSKKFHFVVVFGCDHGVKSTFDAGFGQKVDFGIDVLSGYEHRLVPGPAGRDIHKFWDLRFPWLGDPWFGLDPDLIVLHGWRTCMLWQAAGWARRRGVPYLVRGENPLFPGQSLPGGLIQRARRGLVQQMLNGASGVLTLGEANQRFYRAMGVAEERLHPVPYFVDVNAVAAHADQGRAAKNELRQQWGIPPDAFVVVCVGKLQPRKRAADMIEVLAALPEAVHVLWIGSGETEMANRQRVRQLGLEKRFHLAGFLAAVDTWKTLGIADIFAMPSESEKWGLAINEAVAAGLPVLVSDQCGAAENLVVCGKNGDVVRTGEIAQWISTIKAWQIRLSGNEPFDRGGQWTLAQSHSTEAAAAAFEASILPYLKPSLASAGKP